MPSPYYENHELVCPVRVNMETAKDEVLGVVQKIVPEWAGQAGAVSQISGGITNLLFKVEGAEGLPVVLVRVFGTNTEVMINRDDDNRTCALLSKKGFGPLFWGMFENGRVEGFIPAVPVECENMGDAALAPLIAQELRKMHEMDLPPQTAPVLFPKTTQWMCMARALDFSEAPAKQARYEKNFDFAALQGELEWLEKELTGEGIHPFLKENVFSHNDLLNGNILLPKDADPVTKVHFIDYEYGGWNLRGFDFGNHWAEYAGTDCDYPKSFPTQEVRERFVRAYIDGHPSFPAADDAAVARLTADATKFTLAAHLYWGFWAVLQAKHSPIDFDFMEYARQRFDGYFLQKGEFFATAQ